MSDSPELFELDSEEDDDIVAHRLRRADKARRSARQATGASSEPVTPAVDDGTGVSDAVESVFELDPEDDDIFARRRPARPAAPAAPGNGRWFVFAIIVGVVVGVVLGIAMLSDRNGTTAQDNPHGDDTMATPPMPKMDAELVVTITQLRAALEQNPEDVDVLLDLGYALRSFATTSAADATTAEARAAMEEVFTYWSKASELAPDRQEPWYYLGMYYYQHLDPPDLVQTQAMLEKVVAIDPDSELGAAAKRRLQSLAGGTDTP